MTSDTRHGTAPAPAQSLSRLSQRSTSHDSTDMSQPDRPPNGGSSPTVLVVDDVSTAREITCRLLSESGFRVYGAGCAAQALEILASVRPAIDLVVTGVVMPEVSGVELAQRIRK